MRKKFYRPIIRSFVIKKNGNVVNFNITHIKRTKTFPQTTKVKRDLVRKFPKHSNAPKPVLYINYRINHRLPAQQRGILPAWDPKYVVSEPYVAEKWKPRLIPGPITNAYAISMRDETMAILRKRLGPWSDQVEKWNATNGRLIEKQTWINIGRIKKNCTLRRGEIGCYDSHSAIWAHIVKNSLPMTLIMEDDAEFHYSTNTIQKLNNLFRDIQSKRINFDVLYLCHIPRHHKDNMKRKISPYLSIPNVFAGLMCYLVTYEGAKKLLKHSIPYELPADVFIMELHKKNLINSLISFPSFGFVFSLASDTGSIL